jgi:FAD/FMN-containing dehydrogenase
VTPTGQILDLNGSLEKNNTGVDLRQLFIGSEGILGVITAATLKLTRMPARLDVSLLALPDLDGVLRLFAEARRGPFVISAYEFFTDRCLARVRRHRKVREPFTEPSPYYVLLEVEANDRAALDQWLARLFERQLVSDGTVAQDSGQARSLWELREGISESLSATGLPHKNDIALPVAALGAFCSELEQTFARAWPDFEICLFGHIGDGNLHVNVMKPDSMEKTEFLRKAREADAALMELVRKHRGSVSAEHGIGLLKRDWLGHCRSEQEIALMRALKATLDPAGILNPGKVLPA